MSLSTVLRKEHKILNASSQAKYHSSSSTHSHRRLSTFLPQIATIELVLDPSYSIKKIRLLTMSPKSYNTTGQDLDLRLPRLLCLHGGGTNAKIFKSQCRVLSRQLKGYFRLCYVEAPWDSDAGPDVTSVYQEYKPFRRWLRWRPWHPEIEAGAAVREIERSIDIAIAQDNAEGVTGEFVGLIGFSQGAKMCASLLLRQQARAKMFGPKHPAVKTRYRFAVLFAGRGPLVTLDRALLNSPALADASETGLDRSDYCNRVDTRHILQIPTVHVHGLRDQGLPLHREFMKAYCQAGTTRLVEWDGDHRVPIKSKEVAAVVGSLLEVAHQTGALRY